VIEKQIGQKIKEIRKKKGISQMGLAEKVGLSFQQIQKYEKGTSKISVSRLFQIAEALGVDIHTFFEKPQNSVSVAMEETKTYGLKLTPQEKELVNLFRNIDNKKVKQGILMMLRGICEQKRDGH